MICGFVVVLTIAMSASTSGPQTEQSTDDLRWRVNNEVELLVERNTLLPITHDIGHHLTIERTPESIQRIVFRPAVIVHGRGEIAEIRIEGDEVIVEVTP